MSSIAVKIFDCRQILTVLSLLAAACCVSCNRSGNAPGTGGTIVKPSPEESLQLIMDMFRRRMEDTPIGFVATAPGGRTAMTGTNRVSHELIRPTKEGEPYKAIVTVVSESHYTILRAPEDKEDSRDKPAEDQRDFPTEELDQDGPSFDAKALGDSAKQKSATGLGDPPVDRRKDRKEGKYELVYENDRWDLVTKLDDQTEKAIENAFKNALDTQN